MTPIPLDQISLRWRDHKSAMWWLALLYRRPAKVHEVLKGFSRGVGIKTGVWLYFHSLPYIIATSAFGQFVVFGLLNLPHKNTPFGTTGLLFYFYWIAAGIATGIAAGVAFGIAAGIVDGIAFGIALGIVLGIVGGIADGIVGGIALGTAGGIVRGIAAGIAFGIVVGSALISFGKFATRIATLIATMIALGIALGIIGWIRGETAFGVAFGIATQTTILRFYYYPFHLFLLWPNPRVHWYRFHPVAWDDLCAVPFIRLHQLLVGYTETTPEGEAEIERLIADYPSQKREALRAKTILTARISAKLIDLAKLNEVLARLPEGEKGFLQQTARVREWGNEICQLQLRLDTINRPAFREPTIGQLCGKIENFRHRIAGLHEPLASEFRKAADAWLLIAERQLGEARRITSKEKTTQVFRAGDPADRDSEAFAPRYGVVGELEQQIMLSTGCPGIVLYGRRRTGKSTILRNLTGFLPTEVIPVNASMQNPALFTSTQDFVGFISSEVNTQLGNLKVADLPSPDLTGLFRFLGDCNNKLEAEGKRLLLGVDEYETIDRKIGEGVFKTDLLDTVRESIQSHRRITWIFAGSHEITELVNAEWTSYLVSARTIEVPFFTPAETRLLLTDPLKHSSLWRNNPDKRPQFDPAFWGDTAHNCGIDRIQAEAAGWPHLVQLMAETIVDLINEEDADDVSPELMERALNKAIVRGHNVLHTLMRGESLLPGEWDYLSAFRDVAMQAPPTDRGITKSLRRRLLIEENGEHWQLRVPLMARWLKVRGE